MNVVRSILDIITRFFNPLISMLSGRSFWLAMMFVATRSNACRLASSPSLSIWCVACLIESPLVSKASCTPLCWSMRLSRTGWMDAQMTSEILVLKAEKSSEGLAAGYMRENSSSIICAMSRPNSRPSCLSMMRQQMSLRLLSLAMATPILAIST
eukprot:CAMPEP_0170178116 /NCGR_PEP_ID=MMETSP0040_2-20121228/11675_1 /TAXON_ID=641309 /ORGANISM="Lotharella oceanica, Strain CCMP622" /LENGTH=154 /DNA_ID=CAMNT_0010421081 /DNA_START=385 /DNA_END=849 /DNA_ORIENTATION=+